MTKTLFVEKINVISLVVKVYFLATMTFIPDFANSMGYFPFDESIKNEVNRWNTELAPLIDDEIENAIENNISSATQLVSWSHTRQKTVVFHKPQTHRLNENGFFLSYLHTNAVSQYLTFRLVESLEKKNKDMVLIDEGLGVDLNPESLQSSMEAKSVKSLGLHLFPNGMPKKFSGLNPEQLEFLAAFGGLQTAYFLGLLSEVQSDGNGLYNAHNHECENYGNLSQACKQDIFDKREFSLMVKLTNLSSKQSNRKIFLINFGAKHNFENRFDNSEYAIFKRFDVSQENTIQTKIEDYVKSDCTLCYVYIYGSSNLTPILKAFTKAFGVRKNRDYELQSLTKLKPFWLYSYDQIINFGSNWTAVFKD